jgi:curved DNA-binding protein
LFRAVTARGKVIFKFMANYYDILGVGKSSSEKEIKQAYRDLARKYHPDVNPDDKQAEDKFKKINEAYEVLSNPESKKKYDMYGDNWQNLGNPNHGTDFGSWWPFGQAGRGRSSENWSTNFDDFEDLFSGNVGGRRRKRYSAKPIKVEISLKEAFSGTTRQISIKDSGRTKKIEVTIPAGVDTGNKMPLEPEGMVLNIKVAPDIKFKRNKNHLYTDVDVEFDDLILGCEIEVEHLTGKIVLVIPANSQNKQKFKLHGKGMPIYKGDGKRGDFFVIVNAVIPDSMSEKQKQHILNYSQLKSDN